MNFLIGDYVLLALAIALGVMGIFRGLSGAMAFICGASAAASIAVFGWDFSAQYLSETWARIIATITASIVAFGLIRMFIKKIVNSFLAQPSDAILGLFIGVLVAAALLFAWAYLNWHTEYSALATFLSKYVR